MQRIPPGREIIFKEVDLFIIIWKDKPAREGWISAMREHNLEEKVFAEIESKNPEGQPSLESYREGTKIIGTAQGLP